MNVRIYGQIIDILTGESEFHSFAFNDWPDNLPVPSTYVHSANLELFTQDEARSWASNEPDFTKRILTPLRRSYRQTGNYQNLRARRLCVVLGHMAHSQDFRWR